MPQPVAGRSEEDRGLEAASVAAVGTGRGTVPLRGAGETGVVDPPPRTVLAIQALGRPLSLHLGRPRNSGLTHSTR